MPLARTNMRGWLLKSRLAVNGIQWRSSFSRVISMWVSRLPMPVVSTECGSDLCRGRTQPRHEFNGAHERQARGRRLHRDRGNRVALPVANRDSDAGHAEHVFLVINRVPDAHDPVELGLEYRPLSDGALGEPLQRHQLEQPLALAWRQVREEQLAARTAVERQAYTPFGQVQAQRPGCLDAVEIDERA